MKVRIPIRPTIFLPPKLQRADESRFKQRTLTSWFWWVPFHPTPLRARISIEWRRSGALSVGHNSPIPTL